MPLNARFLEFLADIEPSPTTKSNAMTAHTRLRSIMLADEAFQPLQSLSASGCKITEAATHLYPDHLLI